MATALKIASTPSITAREILEHIQAEPCPYWSNVVDGVRMAPERNLDADIKAMLADRGLTPREVDATYQHATALYLSVSGRSDTDGMTAQLEVAVGMCDFLLAMRKMR